MRTPPFLRSLTRMVNFGATAGIDLEQGFHLEHPDGADILLGDFALAADFRQQPFGIGIALAPDIQPEPDAIGHARPVRRRVHASAHAGARCLVRTRPLLARPVVRAGSRGALFARAFVRAACVRAPAAVPLEGLVLDVFRRGQAGAVHLHKGRRQLARAVRLQQRIGHRQIVFACRARPAADFAAAVPGPPCGFPRPRADCPTPH